MGVHARGRGPGDTFSLPYFAVDDLAEAVRRVEELDGSVVHPGDRWVICKDSEGNPFALARQRPRRSSPRGSRRRRALAPAAPAAPRARRASA